MKKETKKQGDLKFRLHDRKWLLQYLKDSGYQNPEADIEVISDILKEGAPRESEKKVISALEKKESIQGITGYTYVKGGKNTCGRECNTPGGGDERPSRALQ